MDHIVNDDTGDESATPFGTEARPINKDEKDDLYHSSLLSGNPNDVNADHNNTIDADMDDGQLFDESKILKKNKMKNR